MNIIIFLLGFFYGSLVGTALFCLLIENIKKDKTEKTLNKLINKRHKITKNIIKQMNKDSKKNIKEISEYIDKYIFIDNIIYDIDKHIPHID